jgi:protein-S-isoprenylcysteine O-methyltransferase Ste14
LSGIYVVIILPIIAIYVSFFVDSLINVPWIIPFPINLIIAIIAFIVGFFWAIWSNVSLFKKGEGSPVPLKETQTKVLVMEGPYKYTRNPMIFGYVLFWIGLGFLFKSVFLLVGFTLIITIALIIIVKLWEEKNLERRFGSSYIDYKSKVSFLIPLPPKKA